MAFLLVIMLVNSILGATSPGEFHGRLIFKENFSCPVSDRWILSVPPRSRLNAYRGNPPPAFDNNGTVTAHSGAISKRIFRLREGLIIGCDMKACLGDGSSWFGGSFGLIRSPLDFRRGSWPEFLAGMRYDYLGDIPWMKGVIREGGTLTCYLIDEDGDLELLRRPYRDRYLEEWHHYEIRIKPSGFVEFRIDGELIYYSRKRISYEFDNLPLLLGHRSNRSGKVYHDNIRVWAYKSIKPGVMSKIPSEAGE